jgi:hypothetical protein
MIRCGFDKVISPPPGIIDQWGFSIITLFDEAIEKFNDMPGMLAYGRAG